MPSWLEFSQPLLRRLPRGARDALRFVANPRREARYLADWKEFRRSTRGITDALRAVPAHSGDEVLIHSIHGYVPSLKEEAMYGAMLAASGIRPVYLTSRSGGLDRYLRVAPNARFIYWEEFSQDPTAAEIRLALDMVQATTSVRELISLEHDGIAIGRHVLSSFMRKRRIGTVNLDEHRNALAESVARSLSAARTSTHVLDARGISTVLMHERGYTPYGEFFDEALKRGHRTVQWCASHRDDARVFKAYATETRTAHPYSLSADTWRHVLDAPFTDADGDRLLSQWENFYASKSWFNFQRLQHLTEPLSREDVLAELQLDPSKPTAAVFAHIFWDATHFFGDGLYDDYQQWFIETVRLANRSTNVNWVIKLHPVNVWSAVVNGNAGAKYLEIAALEQAAVQLAPHVKLVMPNTTISGWSLYQALDYCFTVRGTVGIEIAMLGKRVVTAGTGHYYARGFTTDPQSREEYERIVLDPTALPEVTLVERDRARRYAACLVSRKAYEFDTHRCEYSSAPDTFMPLNGQIRVLLSGDAFRKSPTAATWANWLTASNEEDCLA